MDGFTTFVFLHIISGVIIAGLALWVYNLRKQIQMMHASFIEHSQSSQELLNELKKAVEMRNNPLGALFGQLTEPGAQQVPNLDPQPQLPPQQIPEAPEAVDPDEDDDITTLGEITS